MNRTLTKAEEQIMQVLWGLESATVSEIISLMPQPQPAYNTVSTIIRILETKAFVDHEQQGRGYRYFPIVSKEEYKEQTARKLVEGYFEGSFNSLVSFFVQKKDINIKELEDLLKQIKK